MASELFRSDLPSTGTRRRASVLPISVAAHIVVLAAIFAAPLLGDIEFPPPNRPLNYAYTSIELPPPPPVTLMAPPAQPVSTSSPAKAPIEAPAEIKPESAIEPGEAFSSDPNGDDGGVPLGIPGAVGPPVAPLPPPPPPPDRKPLVVGGRVRAPRRLVSLAPVYPQTAQAARVQGEVVVEAVIGEDGKVRQAKVVRGVLLLNDAALTAVRQWVFTPTTLNGEPVAVIMTVTVVFSLQ
jgi:periplasmic protein TonB